MKKIFTGLIILFSCVIVFFSLFGERLYYMTKPNVEAFRVLGSFITSDGVMMCEIPKEAVFEDKYIYVVSSVEGFSLTISTIERREVVFADTEDIPFFGYNDSDTHVYVTQGLRNGDIIVISTDRELKDGVRVAVSDYL